MTFGLLDCITICGIDFWSKCIPEEKKTCWKIQISKGQDKSGWSGSEVSVALHILSKTQLKDAGLSRNIPWTPENPFFRSYQIAYCFHPSVIKSSCEFFPAGGFHLLPSLRHNFVQISTKPGGLICWRHAPGGITSCFFTYRVYSQSTWLMLWCSAACDE